eukprot:6178824-Amphidinium_carterae.1
MERGRPETLLLIQLPVRKTRPPSPGPGPLRKTDWKPIALQYLEGSHIILHSYSAKAHDMPSEDVVRDRVPLRVVHQPKKVKGRWLMPKDTYFHSIDLGSGQQVSVVAGTQYIDGMWGHLHSCVSTSHRSGFSTIDGMVPS